MSSKKPEKIKVQIELGELKHTIEGGSEEVIKEIIAFLSKIYPTYDIASKLVYVPDYSKILANLSSFVNLTLDGEIILLKHFSSTDEAIGAALLTAYVASKLGKREDTLSVEELTRITGKSEKTVRNTLAEMIKAGIVERVEKGTYRITPLGVREVNESIKLFKEAKEE